MLFMGIDVGTQGVRSVVADEKGKVVAAKSIAFAKLNESDVPTHYEQRAEVWWEAAVGSITEVTRQLRAAGYRPEEISSIAIDGTSATVLPIDRDGNALCNALMYNDGRAGEQVKTVRKFAAAHEQKMGLRFNASFALPRLLWFKEELPETYEKCWKIIHQTDYMVGKLCGEYGVSDYSNSLKTGYDLIDDRWPEFFSQLGLDTEKLPRIIKPGEKIANVTQEAASALGLSTETVVVAGATDGYASALAAGACRVGDWASIIGTTLVLKGVSKDIVIDPTGSSYCHKLPTGAWMVGGASNVGGRCLNARFGTERFDYYNQFVDALSPTGVLIYPLTGKGERYPFVDANAEEFIVGDASDEKVMYTALMEGVGLVERLGYELNLQNGCTVGDVIYTSGGACKSDEWLRIRASILNRSLKVPAVVDAAMGMVLVAASHHFGDLEQAAANLLTFVKVVDPVADKVAKYDEMYKKFYEECKKHFAMEN